MLPICLLVLSVAVIFVNGWTDAPNAIATAVTTGAVPYGKAVRLAALCNLAGIVVMSLISSSVTETVLAVASFDGVSAGGVLAGLCAAMLTIVLFATAAWAFGLPTSESHALIAALAGAAAAGGSGANGRAWGKVLWGLLLSLLLGFCLGYVLTRALRPVLQRQGAERVRRLQLFSAGCMAFMHGAQDGQKFIAVLVTVDLLARGGELSGGVDIRRHPLALLLCAAAMALGTAAGGRRIIDTVGEKMVRLQPYQGVGSDLAGGICLLAASLTGIPMSTTHTKTTAIMGAGLAGGDGELRLSVAGSMLGAWAVTFPVCGGLSWLLTRLMQAFLS